VWVRVPPRLLLLDSSSLFLESFDTYPDLGYVSSSCSGLHGSKIVLAARSFFLSGKGIGVSLVDQGRVVVL
jgi:hypothetical protein